MSQPTPYTRFQDYSQYQASNPLPGPKLQGSDLDAEFDRIKTTLDQLVGNIGLIQRDDGALRNASVSPDTITSALAIMIANWSIKGPWVTATAYALKDYVTNGGNGYVCVVAHTAGVFATDLAAGKWSLVSTKGDQGLQGIQGVQGVKGDTGPMVPAFRNRIINGCFRVDQRRVTQVNNNAGTYILDRWYAGVVDTGVGDQIGIGRFTGTGGNQNMLLIQGFSSNVSTRVGQRIEASNCYDMRNQNVVGSFMVHRTGFATLQQITWTAYYAGAPDNWASRVQIATGVLPVSDTPTAVNFTFNAGANAGNGINIEFSTGPLAIGESYFLQAVQLELGTVPTDFERRTINTELALCQRYYEKSYSQAVQPGTVSFNGAVITAATAGGGINCSVTFKVAKRAAPAVELYSTQSGSSGSIRDESGADRVTSAIRIGDSQFSVAFSPSTGGATHSFQFTVDAEL